MNLSKRATTPEKKREIIERLFKVWGDHPELRLAQLIWHVTGKRDFFYDEDEDFIQSIEIEYAGW